MTADAGMEEFFAKEVETEDERKYLSRRQFLTGAMTGGAAGLAVAAGTGVAVWKISDAELQATLTNASAEIARLEGLVDLYENLEKVGLDAILATGMAAVALPVEAVEAGATALKEGLDKLEEALLSLEEALPSAEESILWLEGKVSALADSIEKIELTVGNALEKATDNPVAQALTDFTAMILDNLPFGIGDRIRNVLDELVTLVTSVDELIEGLNTHLLEPLREKWFSSEDGKGIAAALIDPLIENVLDPLESHLLELATLADTWQDKLVSPTEKALTEREHIQQEIIQYKKDNGLL